MAIISSCILKYITNNLHKHRESLLFEDKCYLTLTWLLWGLLLLSYEQGQFLTNKHLSLNQSMNVYFVRDLHSLFFLVQNEVFPEEEKKNQIKPKFQNFLFKLNYSLVVITSFMLSHICSSNLTSYSITIHLLNQKKKKNQQQ